MEPLTESEEDRLRLTLSLIAKEADREATAQAAHRNRRRVLTGMLIAAAVAISMGIAVTGDPSSTAGRPGPRGDGKLTTAGAIACSRVIAEGDVVSVRDAPQPDRVILTFHVKDWLKPAHGAQQVDLNVVDPAKDGLLKRWQPGEHVLIVVETDRDNHVNTYRGDTIAERRAELEPALPKALGMKCSNRADS
ncbi:hypothetical protein [Streptomyces sp. NBC_01800]|uniref:hypothetical protein n=1 Tax=Streptomyces sp. NBC_01800 TaxID=2975945 RepID=UPI002DDB9B83|nr:hypothetical protein [Streptomyces sp. NBC_01800]WSA68869.1 hypothetical protein OIE65_18800 [Streptomyces sp. NBC_01800]